ncbi:MAG: tRNA preQ1(34) S-adenosylmethionine ribosyltransferase-isomerase QueA [Armatimonadetes bacterium]|nr:tRNA preQ1(34) S-adenosylmethionine ribosyltransferase-isomerase QueA [Armatimonadota bacterium]
MRLADFDYCLPEELIAQAPLEDRAASRMLVLDKETGEIQHRAFRDIVQVLRPGDLLVMNDTRVTAQRLLGERPTGGKVEALLLSEKDGQFEALMRPAKKLKPGSVVQFEGGLQARVVQDLGEGRKLIQFLQDDYKRRLRTAGRVPLPPYVHEPLQDPERYQTVYARRPGSAAAHTAGLHFTQELLQRLKDNGVETATVTLDVSIDTFRPVSTDNIEDHTMHGERCSVPEDTAKKVSEAKGRVVAVGTTTARTLETFATGVRKIEPGETVSKIFITPGYRFKAVDAMLTNFHMPRTTMLMMVSALAGRANIRSAYQRAAEERYRFLSFGDSMMIL